jgi:hypothetical protein
MSKYSVLCPLLMLAMALMSLPALRARSNGGGPLFFALPASPAPGAVASDDWGNVFVAVAGQISEFDSSVTFIGLFDESNLGDPDFVPDPTGGVATFRAQVLDSEVKDRVEKKTVGNALCPDPCTYSAYYPGPLCRYDLSEL